DRRVAGAQRGGEDDDVLHDRRPDLAGRRAGVPGRQGADEAPDLPARAPGHRLPRAGALDLPPTDGGREHPGDPGDDEAVAVGAEAAARRAARRAGASTRPAVEGVLALGW